MLAVRWIMRGRILTAILLSTVAPAMAAQTAAPPTPAQPPKKDTPKPLTLTGCVTPDAANAGHFTLADFTTGTPTYRLAGTDLAAIWANGSSSSAPRRSPS